MDTRGEVWKMIVVIIPCVAATLIAVSRIMDARHHPFDVISGSLLGIVSAWICYRQYFPPLSEPWKKGRAFPIRSWGTEPPIPPQAAYSRTTYHDDVIPLRDVDNERLYAPRERQLRDASEEMQDQAASQDQRLPVVVGNQRRNRDTYSSSSSEDEPAGYEMNTHRDRRVPAAASYQPYNTAYHSAGRSDGDPLNAARGSGEHHLAGEV